MNNILQIPKVVVELPPIPSWCLFRTLATYDNTFFYSDLHLTPGQINEPFHEFLDIVEAELPDLVVEVGDGEELVWFTYNQLIAERESRLTLEREKKIAEKVEYWKIPGNHNPNIAEHAEWLFPIKIMPRQVEVMGIHVEHGDRWDPTIAWWNFWVRQPFVKARLPWLYMRLFGSPREWKAQDQTGWTWRNALLYNIPFEKYAADNQTHLIFGHTHQPYLKTTQDKLQIGNCGDFCDSYSFIQVIEGKWKLRWVR